MFACTGVFVKAAQQQLLQATGLNEELPKTAVCFTCSATCIIKCMSGSPVTMVGVAWGPTLQGQGLIGQNI